MRFKYLLDLYKTKFVAHILSFEVLFSTFLNVLVGYQLQTYIEYLLGCFDNSGDTWTMRLTLNNAKFYCFLLNSAHFSKIFSLTS